MVKNVAKSVSAKTMVNVIHKVANVIAQPVGRVTFVPIVVNRELMV